MKDRTDMVHVGEGRAYLTPGPKTTPYVPESAYISAVTQRAEFRGALREARDRIAALEEAVQAVSDLISESTGVAGLHLNGDDAPWEDLLADGCLEDWLAPLSKVIQSEREVKDEDC